MGNKFFPSLHAWSEGRVHVNTDNSSEGMYLRTSGVDGVSISVESAKEIRDMLIERYGLPEPVTFQSQFAELAVGDKFTILDGPLDETPWKAIKVSSTQFFNKTLRHLRRAEDITSRYTIVKNGTARG